MIGIRGSGMGSTLLFQSAQERGSCLVLVSEKQILGSWSISVAKGLRPCGFTHIKYPPVAGTISRLGKDVGF